MFYVFADIQGQEQQPEPAEALAIPAAPAIPAAEQHVEEIRALNEEALPDSKSTHLFPSSAIISLRKQYSESVLA